MVPRSAQRLLQARVTLQSELDEAEQRIGELRAAIAAQQRAFESLGVSVRDNTPALRRFAATLRELRLQKQRWQRAANALRRMQPPKSST